ncbi:RxLR effector protein [Phytophthora megakarya]|uniref:RxLR effector protein n=1 Tax=Phytophthora megakarya TaxID=4795 RepID=A0A225UJT9_9STRA|nr:RxLR effector protein [Phytophthora megakarya]
MRSVFYIALAVVALARSSFVAASTNADDSQFLSKTNSEFTPDAVIRSDSQKRFLRVAAPENVDLAADDEERTKYKSLQGIYKKLDGGAKKAKKVPRFASLQDITKKLDNAKKATRIRQKRMSLRKIYKRLDDQRNAARNV